MTSHVHELSEREVQEIIAEHPWLLSLDYEQVPELANKGMERHLSDRKRVDLILRDRRSGRPVLVEFKAVPLKRENIGQILEYRARFTQEISNEDSLLAEAFGNFLVAPILLLVVPTCSVEARLACNLAGIDVHEYQEKLPEWTQPKTIRTFEKFKEAIVKAELPFSRERHQHVTRIYRELREYFESDMESEWTNYRKPSGEYFSEFNHLFINKWIYSEYEISIGVYEEIFNPPHRIIFELYSENKEFLEKYAENYRQQELQPANTSEIQDDPDGWYYWQFELPMKAFFDKPKDTIRPLVEQYYTVMDALGWFAE